MKIEYGTKMKFMEIPIGHFFLGGDCVFQSVRSGEVLQHTFAPDHPVMVCYYSLEGKKSQFQKGQVTEDFFQADFTYMCGDKAMVDKMLVIYEEQQKK